MNSPAPSDIEYHLAHAWEQRGKLGRALRGYRRVIELDSTHANAALHLGRLLLAQERPHEALQVFQNALTANPNQAELHKGLVNALIARGGLDAAFNYYGLTRRDDKFLDISPQAILCCSVVRNEALRLPFFLEYYRRLGVTRFMMVDNASQDETLAYLQAQPDVYVWHSAYSFNAANFGAGWFEVLLRAYGRQHWSVIADTDELLVYPGSTAHEQSERRGRTLAELCADLERKHKRVLTAMLVDMYSDKPIRDTHYTRGESFFDLCPFFDRRVYHRASPEAGPYKNQTVYFGGVRQRVFGDAIGYYLSKTPLLRYDDDTVLAGGQHWTNLPASQIATETGALLHFKFFSTFPTYAAAQAERQEHYGNAEQYVEYADRLAQNPALTLYDTNESIRFEQSQQLTDMGVMQTDKESAPHTIEPPRIAPVATGSPRPFWSVMVTVYDRTQYLEQALCSVLAQAGDADEMQIEVIQDCANAAAQNEVKAIVQRAGGGRVKLFSPPQTLGHPEIFNLCLERAQGQWVHILHDDDWLEPGFYHALQNGIFGEPASGAAFCRHIYSEASGNPLRLSWLERETAGTIDDWLERIAVFCRLQTPAMVVKRDLYEQWGGFDAAAGSAFDWEMWLRLAAHSTVWYEPEPLAHFRVHTASASTSLVRSGKQIADARRVIELTRTYLPAAHAETLERRAREYHARYAFGLARNFLAQGDADAALANLREGLLCSQSQETLNDLTALLAWGAQ